MIYSVLLTSLNVYKIDEINQWILMNCTEKVEDQMIRKRVEKSDGFTYSQMVGIKYWFKNKDDALIFKLTWGGK